jgi:ribosomal protein S18 acetylase RimI-like enzyme
MDRRDILLRPAAKSDAASLAVLVDIAGHGLPAFVWERMKAPGQSLIEYGRARARRDSGAFSYQNATIAESEGEIAGCLVDYRLDDPYNIGNLDTVLEPLRPLVNLEAKAPGSWYVNVLATFPEFRGRGIGTTLLAAAEERARTCHATMVSIIVAAENSDAARLYRRLGYRERARAPLVQFPGSVHRGDWLLMAKVLP